MNVVQIHLMMNHVPVVAPMIAAVLLAAGFLARSQHVMRAGLAALVVGALAAIPVFFTGEPVEDVAKKLPGVTESRIETHEDSAKASVVFLGVMGIGGLAALWGFRRRAVPAAVGSVLLVLSLVAAGQVAWTAHLGGMIRHSELQGGAVAAGDAGAREGGGDRAGGGDGAGGGDRAGGETEGHEDDD
jgi:uncharacterized membrane protein